MKLALAMICRGTAEEAKHLDVCLGYAKEHVDKIFVTLNAPEGQAIDPSCYKICKRHGAIVSEYVWQDDFSAARNFNFSQVPQEYDYILWLDADDALRGGKLMRQMIEKNVKDGYAMWYQYDFDEHKRPYIVHQKLRIVKNDGSFTWVSRLHESLVSNRGVGTYLLTGCDVLHLSTPKHFEANKERNLRIALKGREESPKDPRSYWNTGNAYQGSGMFAEALEEFAIFLATTQSEEERYIAYLRVAEAHYNLGDQFASIDKLRYAIGMKPSYPDAYIKMGAILLGMKRYKEAIEYLSISLQIKAPEYTIVVFNPRQYDFEPIRMLATCYFEMNQMDDALQYFELCRKIYPKDKDLEQVTESVKKAVVRNKEMRDKSELLEKLTDEDLRKELANLPAEERSHPHITHLANTRFVKAESSGKDVVIFCGFTQHTWNPEIAQNEGVGGSEEAVIHLARRWAKAGYNVTVYNSCGHAPQEYYVDRDLTKSVVFAPFWMWNYRDKQDVTILWRHPYMGEYEINSGKVLLDMHDVLEPGEFTPRRLNGIDLILFKTRAHAAIYPKLPPEKVRVLPNGIEPEQFENKVKRDPNLIINTSSSDRSLSTVLDVFELVKKENPKAKLEWAYGWGVFDNAHGENKVMMEWKASMQARMKELGVIEAGKLNTQEVADLYQRGSVFLYPTGFYEIFCISALKAQYAGAYPVTSDFAALGEVLGSWSTKIPAGLTKDTWVKPYQFDFGIKGQEKQYADAVLEALESERKLPGVIRDGLERMYSWDRVADSWIELFV